MKNYLLVFMLLAALLSACNLPVVSKAAQPNLAQTITAQALMIQNGNVQAGQTSAAPAAVLPAATLTLTQQASAGSNNSVNATSTPTLTPTLTLTPAPSQTGSLGVVMVSVTTDTNCRSGPGPVYPPTGVLLVGQNAVVTAKNTPSNYWIIKNAQNPGTTCWLWGQYAVINGDPSKLPEAAIPPTPTPTVTPTATITPTPSFPAAPSGLTQTSSCVINPNQNNGLKYLISVSLNWTDKSNDEDGFKLYLYDPVHNPAGGGLPLRTLGPNVNSVQFNLFTNNTTLNIVAKVEAFNSNGASQQISVAVNPGPCPQ